jgi:heptosyltransferase-2
MAGRGRILVIRGGAIGDFVLTLPALRLIRETLPGACLEVMGYKHIIALAEGRYYADATRSIEYGPMAAFFSRGGELDRELCDYFLSFNQIISYLYDPDDLFLNNMRRIGVRDMIMGNPKLDDHEYASVQLARPMERLAMFLDDPHPAIFPTETDRKAAREQLGEGAAAPVIIHPGSGSPRKNWPVERWMEVAGMLLEETDGPVIFVGGEADGDNLRALEARFGVEERVGFLRDLELPVLAAVLAEARLFLGHDSGVSHMAAAVGARCVLLYGPTSATAWAPRGKNVTLVCAEGEEGEMESIPPEMVLGEARERLRE